MSCYFNLSQGLESKEFTKETTYIYCQNFHNLYPYCHFFKFFLKTKIIIQHPATVVPKPEKGNK